MPTPAENARIESFLALDGIAGGSTDQWHPGEIEVTCFGWGVGAAAAGHGGWGEGVGKATFEGLALQARASVASPRLMVSVASATQHPSAILTVRRKGRGGGTPADFLTLSLTGVVVTSFSQHGDEDRVDDEFSLSFASLTESYLPQLADGSLGTPVVGSWDVDSNSEP